MSAYEELTAPVLRYAQRFRATDLERNVYGLWCKTCRQTLIPQVHLDVWRCYGCGRTIDAIALHDLDF